ncbi:MAG: hypothetical protein HYY18_17045 [Planctomycetes bacterium]|nr:hypothetical protein [Planctomycetota bacterium]
MTSRILLLGLLGAVAGAGLAEWTSRDEVLEEEVPCEALPSFATARDVAAPPEPEDAWVPRLNTLRHPAPPPSEVEEKETYWLDLLNEGTESWRSIAFHTLIDMVRERQASTRTLFALHREFQLHPTGRMLPWILQFPDDASFELLLQSIREETDEMRRIALLDQLRRLANDDDRNFLSSLSIERGRELTRSRRYRAAQELRGLLEDPGDPWTKRVIRSVLKTLVDAG